MSTVSLRVKPRSGRDPGWFVASVQHLGLEFRAEQVLVCSQMELAGCVEVWMWVTLKAATATTVTATTTTTTTTTSSTTSATPTPTYSDQSYSSFSFSKKTQEAQKISWLITPNIFSEIRPESVGARSNLAGLKK